MVVVVVVVFVGVPIFVFPSIISTAADEDEEDNREGVESMDSLIPPLPSPTTLVPALDPSRFT